MLYYLIAAVCPLLGWLIHDNWTTRNQLNSEEIDKVKNWLVVLSILPMVFIFVFRDKYVGADTIGYVRFFEGEVRDYTFRDLLNKELMRVETGYRIYVKLISLLTDNYTVFFFINAIVIFGSLLRFSLKYTKNPFIFFFMFMTLGTYQFVETGLRQSLAMIICLWSIDFIKSRKLIKFLLVILLAYLFHKSAMIFLLLYPLCYVKRYRWMAIVYVCLTFLFMMGFSNFQEIFNEWLGYDYQIEETGNGGIFLMITVLVCVYSTLIMIGKGTDKENQTEIIQMAFMTVVFWLLRLVSRTAERISYYFIFGLYAYFSQTTIYDDTKFSSAMKWGILLICLALFMYRNLGIGYTFVWEGI